jgi:hypothetical protein
MKWQSSTASKGGPLCPLPGGYRKVHGQCDDLTSTLVRYTDDDAQLYLTE